MSEQKIEVEHIRVARRLINRHGKKKAREVAARRLFSNPQSYFWAVVLKEMDVPKQDDELNRVAVTMFGCPDKGEGLEE